MRNIAFFFTIIALTTNVEAAKCRNQGKILYTQDQYCPAGYTDITIDRGGVSTINKSENVQQQEQAFLNRRAEDSRQQQAQLAKQEQQAIMAANNQRSLCQAIDGQVRATENAMRQINAWQQMDQLKREHRALRDQQFQLGCRW